MSNSDAGYKVAVRPWPNYSLLYLRLLFVSALAFTFQQLSARSSSSFNFTIPRELVLLVFCQERPLINASSISSQSSRDRFNTSATPLFVNPQELLHTFQGQRLALEFASVQATTEPNLTQHNTTKSAQLGLPYLAPSEAFDPPVIDSTADHAVPEPDYFSEFFNFDRCSDSRPETEQPSSSPRDDTCTNLHPSSRILPSTATTPPAARRQFSCGSCTKSFPRRCQLKYVHSDTLCKIRDIDERKHN